jgi:ribonuclease E
VHSNNRKVEKALKEALKNDRARIQVGRISTFGLLEMSRQRLRTGVLEASTHTCPVCDGAGIVRTVPSAALGALRVLEAEALKARHSQLTLRLPFEVAIYMLNAKRGQIARIEDLYGVVVEVSPSGELTVGEHEVDGSGPPPEPRAQVTLPALVVEEDEVVVEDEAEEVEEADDEGERPREGRERDGGRRKRRRRGRNRREREDREQPDRADAADIGDEGALADAEAVSRSVADAKPHEDGDPGRRKRRRRGRRGGRRRDGEATSPVADGMTVAEPDVMTTDAVAGAAAVAPDVAADAVAAPPKRGRRKTAVTVEGNAPAAVTTEPADDRPAAAEKPKRSRRRAPDATVTDIATADLAAPAPTVPRRKAAAKVSEPADMVAAEMETEAAAANDAAETPASPRKGWWQRTFGA